MSLKSAAVSGAKWTTVSTGFTAVIQFLQVTVLAWWLKPSDFGLMAMSMLVLNFAEICLDFGMSKAIIHRQDTSREQLSSLYWVNVFVGWVLFAACFAATPLVVIMFREPRLYHLVPLVSALFLIGPIGAQFALLLQKELRFRSLAVVEIVGSLMGALAAIGAAIAGLGVYALVLAQLAGSIVSTAILTMIGLRHWRPMFHFRRADLKGYMGFGLYQMGERTLNFLFSRTDQLLIGMFVGPIALGYYSFSWNLIIQPMNRVNPSLTKVAFPLFARMQNEEERLRRGYLTLIRILATINAPILLGFAAIAPVLIPIVYGVQWTAAVPLIQPLAVVGLLRCIMHPLGTLLLAKGRADLGFIWTLGVVGVNVAGVMISLHLGGLISIAYCLVLLHILYLLAMYTFVIRRLLGPCFSLYMGSLIPALAAAGVMVACVWFLPGLLPVGSTMLVAGQVAIGAIVYGAISILLQWPWLSEMAILFGVRTPFPPAIPRIPPST
jgi:lipopolysaccharide exporter